ncbi:MAG TPA: hypothetical protein VFV33_02330, partial [Gemmatimonadaceae bacterium]|nr:hypothetical protein [Gemmatimonadaceae bacterium]
MTESTAQQDQPSPQPAGRRRFIGVAGNLALLTVSVAVALGIGEVATRLIRPQQPRKVGSLYRPDSLLGFTRLASLDRRINAGEGWVTFRTDRDGYRVARDGRVESDTRVLVLGDSFMEARAVEFEASVPGLLQSSLSQSLGRPVAVRNDGVSGYGPDHYRLSGARALARERFSALLVAVYVGNDVVDRARDRFPAVTFAPYPRARLPKRWTPKDFTASAIRPLMLRLVGVSHLAALVWAQTEAIRPHLGLAEWDFPTTILRSHAGGAEWDVTAGICARLAA